MKALREELAAAVDPRLFMSYGARNATIAPTAEKSRKKRAYEAADRILEYLKKHQLISADTGQVA